MIHKNRKSIRLKNYDYAKAGLYFITICTNHRKTIFGYIDNGCMILNDAGRMIEKWYFELENKFKNIQSHQKVVMPNHIHCIVEIVYDTTPKQNTTGRDAGLPLYEVVQWLKTMTTNEYIRGVKNSGWEVFDKKMWQRNYWEHIIRNEQSYIKLSQYIENNPLQWEMDRLHPNNIEVSNVN